MDTAYKFALCKEQSTSPVFQNILEKFVEHQQTMSSDTLLIPATIRSTNRLFFWSSRFLSVRPLRSATAGSEVNMRPRTFDHCRVGGQHATQDVRPLQGRRSTCDPGRSTTAGSEVNMRPRTFEHRRVGGQHATQDVRPLQGRRSTCDPGRSTTAGSEVNMRPRTFDHCRVGGQHATLDVRPLQGLSPRCDHATIDAGPCQCCPSNKSGPYFGNVTCDLARDHVP